jgi:hypothetical protein
VIQIQLDNSKQAEYLEDIRDIGMQIVFREITKQEVYDAFKKYVEYLSDDIKIQYLNTLKEIINNLNTQTPDDILFKMGQYTKKIQYKEPQIDMDLRMYAEF